MRDEIEGSVSTSKLKLFACVLPEKSTSQLPHLRVAKIEKKKTGFPLKVSHRNSRQCTFYSLYKESAENLRASNSSREVYYLSLTASVLPWWPMSFLAIIRSNMSRQLKLSRSNPHPRSLALLISPGIELGYFSSCCWKRIFG